MMVVPTRRLVRWGIAGAAASFLVIVFPAAWVPLAAFNLLLIGAAVVDWLLTPAATVLEVSRVAPERMWLLANEEVVLQVQNRCGSPLQVRVRDTAPEALRPQTEELESAVPAHGQTRFRYAVRSVARGRHVWGNIHLRYRSILGLWEKEALFAGASEIRIYPNFSALERYHLLAQANRLETLGIRKVRLRGGAWEFESLREYAHGDDIRMIDWKATARRRKLIVRNQEAERNQTVLILVDSGRLMNAEVEGAAKLDYAINTALLLAHVALRRGDKVGLASFSHKVHAWVMPRAHLAQNRLISESLFDLHGDFSESDHGQCLRLVKSRYPKRSLLVMLTDFVDAATAADMIANVQSAGRRHLVLFVALKDPFLEKAARSYPRERFEGFRKAAAVDLLHDRREVLERLRQMGAHVIDAEPGAVTPPLINRYLEITQRGLL